VRVQQYRLQRETLSATQRQANPMPRFSVGCFLRLARQFAFKPCPRKRPVPLDGPQRQAEVFCDFRVGHAGIEPQRHDLTCARVNGLQPRERSLEREQIFDGHSTRFGRLEKIVESQRLHAAAPFVALLMPAVIDQQSAHRLCAECKPVSAPLPFTSAVVLKPQPRLMDQCCRLQSVIAPFAAQVPAGDVTQFAVNDGKKCIGWCWILTGHVCLLQASVRGASLFERLKPRVRLFP
jgi:hypothetical protein